MVTTFEVRHISISIRRAPEDVYRFAAEPQNVPRWATGLARSIRSVGGGEWVAEGGPVGTASVRFTEQNPFGVLDHDVVTPSGVSVHNAIRVIPNGTGSEVIFSLFRASDRSTKEFEEDAATVESDLRLLKSLLEK